MSIEAELDSAFEEGRRHAEQMPFVCNDAVELEDGPEAGLRGSVIVAFLEEGGLSYTVVLSTGRDIRVRPSEVRLLEP